MNFVTDDFPYNFGIGVFGGAEVHAKMGVVIVGLISIRKTLNIIQHIFLMGLNGEVMV